MEMAIPKLYQHDDDPNNNKNQVMQSQDVIVIIVPFPLHGHLSPLLQFSYHISSYNNNIHVHYVSSSTCIHQVRVRAHRIKKNASETPSIRFHGFPLPPFSTPPPDPYAPIKFPAHLQPSFEACLDLRRPVALLMKELSPIAKRIVIIHDPLMASVVQDAASLPNAETYAFQTNSAFSLLSFQCQGQEKPWSKQFRLASGASLEGCFTQEFLDLIIRQAQFVPLKNGDLHNTSRSIEGDYIDLLGKEFLPGKKQWAIGPLVPPGNSEIGNFGSHDIDKCFEWLDKQEPKSVLYISFGTTTMLPGEQIRELALALEESETKFIWVLRDADRGDVSTEESERKDVLPRGYKKRIQGKGMVVSQWIPQVDILRQSSIGGFLSHCGWNSCLESIAMGVPIAAWPMHADQAANAVLLTELLKVALVVKDWSQREKLITSSVIKDAIRKLMASDEGRQIRKHAELLGNTTRQSIDEGGSSRMELDSFIAHITR